MAKHVYYKKQVVVLWYSLAKMEREKRLTLRRQQERKRNSERRKALLMVEYIHVKYPMIYNKASEYYETLDEEYSDKNDLRKVERFKRLKVNTDNSKVYNDNMVLNIPLIFNNSAVNGIQPEGEMIEAVNAIQPEGEMIEAVDGIQPKGEMIEAVNGIQPTLLDPIPPEVVQKVIDELRLDPFLGQLMDEVEQEINQTEQDLMLDIDLEIADDLLEKELAYW